MEDLGSVTTATPPTGRTRTPLDIDLFVHKLDRIETRLKRLEEKQQQASNLQLQQSGGHHHRRPPPATHVQLKQALISRLQILENRVLQLKNVMESPIGPIKMASTSNEIVEASLLQEGPADAGTGRGKNIMERADELIDRKLHRGYRRLQAQKPRLLVKDSKDGRKKGNQNWSDKRRLNKSPSRIYRWFAMGC